MKKRISISLALFFLIICSLFSCKPKGGYSDEKIVLDGLKVLNAKLDTLIDLAKKPEFTHDERRILRGRIREAHQIKMRFLKGLSEDAGGGKSFFHWYCFLSAIDENLVLAENKVFNIRGEVSEFLESARKMKKILEDDLKK